MNTDAPAGPPGATRALGIRRHLALAGWWAPGRVAPSRRGIGAGPASPFTLIELLVVIAIVAILAALLLPALGKARARTRMIACASNQRQACVALTSYANDHGEYPTETTWEEQCSNRTHEGSGSGYEPFRNLVIAGEYVPDGQVLQCSERSKVPGCTSFDHFTTEPWFRYNGPSSVGYWTWHYGHGNWFGYYGWHWYTWSDPPRSSSRGPSYRRDDPQPEGSYYGFQALGSCPRSLVCPPDWSYGYAHEPHMSRPMSATVPMQVQFGWDMNSPHVRNYFFRDGHVEAVTN